jgi:hypothetical protein
MVIAQFVLNPQQDQCGTGDPHPQTCDIENAEPFIFPEISDRGPQIIAEHMAVFSVCTAKPMPVLQPVRFQAFNSGAR